MVDGDEPHPSFLWRPDLAAASKVINTSCRGVLLDKLVAARRPGRGRTDSRPADLLLLAIVGRLDKLHGRISQVSHFDTWMVSHGVVLAGSSRSGRRGGAHGAPRDRLGRADAGPGRLQAPERAARLRAGRGRGPARRVAAGDRSGPAAEAMLGPFVLEQVGPDADLRPGDGAPRGALGHRARLADSRPRRSGRLGPRGGVRPARPPRRRHLPSPPTPPLIPTP